MATSTNSAKESLQKEQQAQHAIEDGGDADLTRALENTFPASDPVASQTATTVGSHQRPEVVKPKGTDR